MIRNAVPTTCTHTGPAYVFDANGWKRWCVDCGAPLNHEERQPNLLVWPVVLFMAALFFLIALSLAISSPVKDGPYVTPSLYPNPPVVRSVP